MQARVLVVDDEPVSRTQVQRILQREGCHADAAEGGQEALRLVSDHPYDLVITDLFMPEMDGVTLVNRLRMRQPGIAAVLMTSWPQDERLQEEHLDVLAKPFTRRELRETMQMALTCPVPNDHEGSASGKPLPGTRLVLPDHSWARVERNGLVTIGVEPAFARRLVGLQSATLCRELEDIPQWEPIARFRLDSGRVEMVRAPVTLRVVRTNWNLIPEPWAVVHDPLRTGWVCAGTASHLSRDIRALRVINAEGRVIAEEEALL